MVRTAGRCTDFEQPSAGSSEPSFEDSGAHSPEALRSAQAAALGARTRKRQADGLQEEEALPTFELTLVPETGADDNHVSLTLRVQFTPTYPEAPPLLSTRPVRGLTEEQTALVTTRHSNGGFISPDTHTHTPLMRCNSCPGDPTC